MSDTNESHEDKVRENRLRRVAARQGYVLTKSGRRDPRALYYGEYFLTDARTNYLETLQQGLSLDEVETVLTDDGSAA